MNLCRHQRPFSLASEEAAATRHPAPCQPQSHLVSWWLALQDRALAEGSEVGIDPTVVKYSYTAVRAAACRSQRHWTVARHDNLKPSLAARMALENWFRILRLCLASQLYSLTSDCWPHIDGHEVKQAGRPDGNRPQPVPNCPASHTGIDGSVSSARYRRHACWFPTRRTKGTLRNITQWNPSRAPIRRAVPS